VSQAMSPRRRGFVMWDEFDIGMLPLSARRSDPAARRVAPVIGNLRTF